MKRLTIYFSTIFILATSPALALISFNSQNNMNSALYTTQSTHATDLSEYDELREDVTNCVKKEKKRSRKIPENYIKNRTEELKGKKLTRPINYKDRFDLGTSDFNSKTWDCSIDAQPNDKIEDEIEVSTVGRPDPTTKPEAEERCINEILRLTAADDWYVSECLSNRIKKNYNIETVDEYYTKIYQFYNKPESVSDSGSESLSTNTESQQTDNGSQTTPTTNTNNNSTSSKISVTVSDYYNNTGIKNITVCSNNNCEKSDKNGKVTFTATTPQNIRIQGASDYHCDKPFDIKSALDELNTPLMEGTPRRSTGIENSQNQFIIKCRKLCTDKDLQKFNKGLKEQNQIKSCYRKSQTEYEITKCNYVDSKPHNNQCKLYRNNITIAGKDIDINKVEISLSKTTSNFKPAKKTTAKDPLITIEDIDLDETKYISARHGEQTIACEFKFYNNTICDFGSLNNNPIEEKVSPGITNTSTENNDNQNQKPDEEKTKENDSSGIIIDSTSDNKLNDTENKNEQQEKSDEEQINKQPTITKEEYEQIESEIEKILTDIKEKIESQCTTEPTIEKCKNKDEIIEQIEKAAKTTLNKLNELGKN